MRSQRFWLWLIVVPGALALGLLAVDRARPLLDTSVDQNWTLAPQLRGQHLDAEIADVDGDGRPERILLGETELLVARRTGLAVAQSNFPTARWGRISHVSDVDGNRRAEIFFQQRYADRSRLSCWWDHQGEPEIVLEMPGIDRNGDGQVDITLNLETVADLDSDGVLEGLLIAGPGLDEGTAGRTRRVVAIELRPGFPVLWETTVAVWPGPVRVADLDGDGQQEVLVGNRAVANDVSVGDTDDLHSYELILEADGSTRLLRERLGAFSCVELIARDLDGDGDLELIRRIEQGAGDRAAEGVILEIAEPRDGSLLAERHFAYAGEIFVEDTDHDGRSEIYLSQINELFQLDHGLRITQRYADVGRVRIRDSGDVDLDGELELLGMAGSNVALILDARLEPLLRTVLPGEIDTCRFVSEGPGFMTLALERDRVSWVDYQIDSVMDAGPGATVPLTTWLLAGSWLGAVILGLVASRSARRRADPGLDWEAADALPALVATLDSTGALRRLNSYGVEWLESVFAPGTPLSAWLNGVRFAPLRQVVARFLRTKEPEIETVIRRGSGSDETTWAVHLSRDGSPEEGGALLVMHDQTGEARSRQALEWAAIAQEMIHNRVKNPLGTILLAIRRMERDLDRRPQDWAERARRALSTLADEVGRMDESCRRFLRFTRLPEASMRPIAPARLVSRVEARMRGAVDEGQRLEFTVDEGLPELFGDAEQLEWMLENLLANARQSLEEQTGQVSLEVYSKDSIEQVEKRLDIEHAVVFEVSDTGKGIPDEQRERIFEPFFTSRPGGSGLGLAIVRQIVDIHHGGIEAESTPGLGTRFTVTLPCRAESGDS